MQNFINWFNFIMFLFFVSAYLYQFVYIFVAFFKKMPALPKNPELHRFAVLIAARNEEAVIGNLITSIQDQTYPGELIRVCVVADNCTDRTAEIARAHGAFVVERFSQQIGKGYALDYLIKRLPRDFQPDAYLVFDADNLLDPHYVEEMNRVYAAGYLASTSYRNSCNYDTNWISAGYSLWFLREARFLNQARMALGTSCAISGTGFMIAASVIRRNNGWIHHLLTEDIEFSVDSVLQGVRIGYCSRAIFYDEQPTTLRQSYRQRLRWCKGFYQVFGKYGRGLIRSAVCQRNFAAYDMLMTIAPATLISITTVLINTVILLASLVTGSWALALSCGKAAGLGLLNYYLILLAVGVITTISERRQIHTNTWQKVKACLTFPCFMFTYFPIAVIALFRRVEWTPIVHTGYAKAQSSLSNANSKL